MRSPGATVVRRHSRQCTKLRLRSTSVSINDRWKRRVFTRAGLTQRSNRTSLPRTTTTTDYRRCSSTPPKANQVPTKVRGITRTKDLSRRRKGLPTSPTSSATAVARKATTRMNAMPGSSVMTYKDPDRTITATESSALRRATGTTRPPTKSKSSLSRPLRAEDRTT
jgi:hypothetical protein